MKSSPPPISTKNRKKKNDIVALWFQLMAMAMAALMAKAAAAIPLSLSLSLSLFQIFSLVRLFQTVWLLESQDNLQCREKCDTLLKNDDAWKIRHEKYNGVMVPKSWSM
jgi:hypothetical protein